MARLESLEPRNWLPLGMRQRLRRLEASVRGEPASVVYGSSYQLELPGMPLDGLRGERILAALVREGLVGPEAVVRPNLAAFAKLERVHAHAYLEQLDDPETIEHAFGLSMTPDLAERAVELQRYMTGGTILAVRAAWRRHELAVNLGGGLHHAHRDRGHGFCLINDIAVAVAELRARGMDEAIAVVDLDIHDGDGTRSLFADDPTVWTLSIHNDHWGSTDARASTAIALGADVGDRAYLAALREHLPAMLDRHRPKLVIYLAGCDPADDDALGNWSITAAGMLARDRYVIGQLRARGIASIVWLLGGGYGSGAWRHAARGLIASMGGPADPKLPTTEALTASRFRHLAAVIDPRELSGHDSGELEFDESDLFGVAPHAKRNPRVLGYYTHAGIEYALERYGLLGRLRKLGFEPRVTIECDTDTGDTVRVFGDPSDELVLVEVRVARDRQTVPGLELLRIEWLLLQNPRASWVAGRAPLPGQEHPGLHMFEEVVMMLLMTCERLELAGIVTVPSHYHVASRWHARTREREDAGELGMKFLDPVVEGRFRALERLLDSLPLAAASRAVEHGKIVDATTGERCSYEPSALILASSEELAARFDEDWEQAAAAAEQAASYERGP